MAGKYFQPGERFPSGRHEKYRDTHEARIRREYMELAKGDFYGTVFKRAKIPHWARVLDLGCGDGRDLEKLAEMGHTGKMIGLEAPNSDPESTKDKLENISDTLKPFGAEVILGDAQAIPLDDSSVDIVIAASVLQEVPDVSTALDEIHRVLSRHGKLIIIENRDGNKPLHHGYLRMMAGLLGAVAPPPFSSRFTHEIAERTIEARDDFVITDEIIQNSKDGYNLPIRTDDEIRQLLYSLDTYRGAFIPILTPEVDELQIHLELMAFEERMRDMWKDARREVWLDAKRRIRYYGAANEKIKRGALICEAKDPVTTNKKKTILSNKTLSWTLGRIIERQ